jgi:hypothetical protein
MAVAVVAAGLVGGLLVAPGSARADAVSTAQARVARLQTVVAAATVTLTEGTRKWEHDRATLVAVNRELAQTKVRARAVQKVADDTAELLRDLARRLYMTPSPTHLELAFTAGPEEFMGALQSLGSLNLVADSRGEIVQRATDARVQLQVQQRRGEELAKQAASLARSSEQRMRDLQALARATSVQLSAAQRDLVRAREAEAARIALLQKQAAQAFVDQLISARQARERARALRAATAAVALPPLCQGLPVEGQQNGFLDPASLCPLWGTQGMSLKGTAADAFNRMTKFHQAALGTPLCVTGGYRTYQRQVELYAEKPGLAAVPGNSEHGWGNAADLCGGIESAGSPAHQWMQVHAADFGWFHPAWAEPTGSKPEPWHWEFSG